MEENYVLVQRGKSQKSAQRSDGKVHRQDGLACDSQRAVLEAVHQAYLRWR